MNNLIEEIYENKINFHVFQLNNLSEFETDLLIGKLSSSIIYKNTLYDRLLQNELNNIEQSVEQNYNKYITILIQYLINDNHYTTNDIKKIIQQIKNVSLAMNDLNQDDLNQDEDDNDNNINQRMKNFIHKLNLSENEKTIKYVMNLSHDNYLELTQIIFLSDIQDEINDLLDIIVQPFIKYKYQKSDKFIANDILFIFLDKLSKDFHIKKNIKENILSKIINFVSSENSYLYYLISKKDVFQIHNYINILPNDIKLNKIMKEIKKLKKGSKTNKKYDYSEHMDYINIFNLNTKKDVKIVRILYIIGGLELKMFLKKLGYEKHYNTLIENDIKTYQKLENLVLKNQIIQKCRLNNKKILPGKVIKNIIFKIYDDNNKLTILKEKNIEIFDEFVKEIEINHDFEINTLEEIETINELKNKKSNLLNLIIILQEQGEDFEDQKNKVDDITQQIQKMLLDFDNQEDMNHYDMEELTSYLNDSNINNNIINNKINTLNLIPDNKYGNNFVKNEYKSSSYNQFDQKLTNIINKYDNEDKINEKKEQKKRFLQIQNEILTGNLSYLMKSLDDKYNTNLFSQHEFISEFLKSKINLIMKFIYQKLNNKNKKIFINSKSSKHDVIYNKLKIIIHSFLIMYIMNNSELNYNDIYDSTKHFIEINEPIKKVIIKFNNKEGEIVDHIGDYYFVKYLGKIIKLRKDEIIIFNDLKGKECRIIKGFYKGFSGIIYNQKDDMVYLTKDLYGKNSEHHISGLHTIKCPKNYVKILEKSENIKTSIIDEDLYQSFNKKKKDLYSLCYFEINKYYINENLVDYKKIFNYVIDIFNLFKISECSRLTELKKYKIKYIKIKKEMNINKNDQRKYLKLKQQLKKYHYKIKNEEKNIPDNLQDNLFNNKKNLNNNYEYILCDDTNIYQLKKIEHKPIIKNKKKIKGLPLKKLKVMKSMNNLVQDIWKNL
jgi:hypothetical protein